MIGCEIFKRLPRTHPRTNKHTYVCVCACICVYVAWCVKRGDKRQWFLLFFLGGILMEYDMAIVQLCDTNELWVKWLNDSLGRIDYWLKEWLSVIVLGVYTFCEYCSVLFRFVSFCFCNCVFFFFLCLEKWQAPSHATCAKQSEQNKRNVRLNVNDLVTMYVGTPSGCKW